MMTTMMKEDKDSYYSEMIVSVSTIVLFAPPAAWGRDSETCLRFSDIGRSFFQFLVVRTILTNFVTLLHGSFVKVAIGCAISAVLLYYYCKNKHAHTDRYTLVPRVNYIEESILLPYTPVETRSVKL